MNALTFGSLFAEIGGLDLGLERAGLECRWQVEIDDYCRQVLAKHWPDVVRYGDIREVRGEDLEHVDVIAGGFPCTDVSQVGRRSGLDGARSGLWSEFARLVRELRPSYVLVENVPGLLVRGMGRVLGDLAACGYDAEWQSLPAAAFGAPHIRERVFILAHADRERQQRSLSERDGDDGPVAQRGECPEDLYPPTFKGGCDGADGAAGVLEDPCGIRRQATAQPESDSAENGVGQNRLLGYASQPQRAWSLEPGMGRTIDGLSAGLDGDRMTWGPGWEDGVARTAHGVPRRVDRLKALGNAVVPQVAEYLGRVIVEAAR